jgi:polyhydroxybutyrate depolymerase
MRRLLPALLLAACADPLPPVPDGGLFQQFCFIPADGGVFTTGLPATVPGCAQPGDAGVFDLHDLGWSIQGGVLVVPPSGPGTPLPVVFGFHGAYGTGDAAREYFAMEGPADGGAIFVYPNAVQGTWDIRANSADGRRVDTLLRLLSQSYCIDPERIYITGLSAGAVFTLFLGCNVPGPFRALASVAGTDHRFDNRCCTGSISGIFIHGTNDDAIPVVQGQFSRNDLLERDNCSGMSTPIGQYCLDYSCPASLDVNYCEWPGGHDIPPWAGQEIWRFFDSQR